MLKITEEALSSIEKALKRGNTVELKRENNKLVVVEIARQVRNKTSITR